MKNGIIKWLVGLILVVVLVFFGFTVEVKEGECAVITRFGAPRAEVTEAGLYLRLPWPFEDVTKYDSRQQYLESNFLETLTQDKRNIIMRSYVVWEIEDTLTYYSSVRTQEVAEQYIRDLVTNATNGVLGSYELTELVSLEEEKIKLDEIQGKIFEQVRTKCLETYGIDVEEVSIIQLSLPDINLQSVFAQMEADRQKDIESIYAEANKEASIIEANANAEAAEIVAKGVTDAAAIKAQMESEVAKIYAEAQAANLELYQFLRQLDTLIGSVNSETTLIIRLDEYPFNILTKYEDLLQDADADGNDLAEAIAALPAAEREEVTDALWALVGQDEE